MGCFSAFFRFFLAHLDEVEMALPLEVSEDSKVRFEVGGNCVCVGLGFEKGFPDASPARLLVSGPASLSDLLSEVPLNGGTVDWRHLSGCGCGWC